MDYWGWRPYVSVAQRRGQALREMAKLKKKGHPVSPVIVDGRTIAKTFWGKAWCENLERYSDFANRLPRGRTYVRNGSVIDLQISPGEIKALVSGSSIYKVAVKVAPVSNALRPPGSTDASWGQTSGKSPRTGASGIALVDLAIAIVVGPVADLGRARHRRHAVDRRDDLVADVAALAEPAVGERRGARLRPLPEHRPQAQA